jgi:hypothetical protein
VLDAENDNAAEYGFFPKVKRIPAQSGVKTLLQLRINAMPSRRLRNVCEGQTHNVPEPPKKSSSLKIV